MPKPTSKQADGNYSYYGTDNCERAGEQIVENDYSVLDVKERDNQAYGCFCKHECSQPE
ncbi:UNVERIFIED_CONTAM: hypothetical protein C7454_1331 [Acidovorax defluvii]